MAKIILNYSQDMIFIESGNGLKSLTFIYQTFSYAPIIENLLSQYLEEGNKDGSIRNSIDYTLDLPTILNTYVGYIKRATNEAYFGPLSLKKTMNNFH